MKAISLWQPYASLVILEEKVFETRHWKIPPGIYTLHAAKHFTNAIEKMCRTHRYFCEAMGRHLPKGESHLVKRHLPFGAALGVIRIGFAYRVEDARDGLSPKELAFGNYEDGRYCSPITVLRKFAKPVLINGHQGLWNFEPTDKSLFEGLPI